MVGNIEIEAQHVEVLPEWRHIIDRHVRHLDGHARYPITNLRLQLIKTAHHRHGNLEGRLSLKHGTEVLVTVTQGEYAVPLINELFQVAERRLDEGLAQREGPTEDRPPAVLQGTVLRYYQDRSFGFIGRPDGSEVYFHLNSLKKGSAPQLVHGTPVRFCQEEGEEGPQAVWVRVID